MQILDKGHTQRSDLADKYLTYMFYFQQLGKCYPFQVSSGPMAVEIGKHAILDTEKGQEYAVLKRVYIDDKKRDNFFIRQFLRQANDADKAHIQKIETMEKDAFHLCKKKALELNLQMKLIRVKYLFDCSKVIFYFTANGRIDFRELVKQLAYKLRTRIEMRQIGIRDEAKILGGIGVCGLNTCCNRFMSRFEPVSLKMAREQNLTSNPSRISGLCGRLMCCMYYEYATYKELKKIFPSIGSKVYHPNGLAEVTSINYISNKIWVKFRRDSKEIMVDLDELNSYRWEHNQGQEVQKKAPPPQEQKPKKTQFVGNPLQRYMSQGVRRLQKRKPATRQGT